WFSAFSSMKRFGFGADKVSEMFFWAAAASYIGGRLFYFFEDPGFFFSHPRALVQLSGSGFVFYGSFLLCVPALFLFFKINRIPFGHGFDTAAVSGAVVHGFGKMGCLLAGCCYGRICEPSWYALHFHHPSANAARDGFLGMPLYPTQIMDAVLIFGMAVTLFILQKKYQQHGRLILIYAFVYGLGRFVTEFFRGDEARGHLFHHSLSHSQFISLLIVPVSLALWFLVSRRVNKNGGAKTRGGVG
ncbi:MAG: prolipoprotein diacylglyceryl transferase, partial [Spirochaetia bacterium]|nr:prolipoprotein diacylglyceryl transferase [Spirochaetia bacterium]